MHTYITSREQLELAINDVLQSPLQWVGCDTETTGLDCHTNIIRLVQFDVENASYILDTWSVPDWTDLFQRLINCKTLKWSFHNFKFDLKFFWANKLDFFGCKVFDTMIASALITAGLDLPNDLAHVAERYVGIEVDKTEQKSDWSIETLTDSQLYYASKDARTTRLLGAKLVRIIYSDNLTEVFKLEMRALYSFAAMEWYGMQLDTDRLELLRPIYENNLLEAEKQFLELVPIRYERHNLLGELIDTGFKLSSSDQVLEVLRDYEIPNPLYNPSSSVEAESDPIINSTGANVIKLLDIVDYPILEALLAHRKAAKLLSAYVYSLPKLVNPITGRVHTNYRQMVSTGRVSSSNPNLQNLSRPDGNELNLRSCFVPAPGYNLVDADYCIAEGTRVSTTRGTIPIEYVSVGDSVYQDTNSTQKVLRVIEKGLLPVKRITTKYGYEIEATDLHKFRVLDRGEYIWKTVGELTKSDCICITAGRASDIEKYVKLPEINYQHHNERFTTFPSEFDENFACFLGYLAGDGSFTSKGISWVVCDKDKEVVEHLNTYAVSAFGRVGKQVQYRGVYEAGITSVPLARVLGFMGASKTSLPDSLYRSPISVIQAYLRGLFEADGSVCDRVTFCSTSEDFIKEIQQLLLICGIISNKSAPKMSKLGTKQPYTLTIPAAFTQMYAATVGFMSDRKQKKLEALCSKTNKSPAIGSMDIPKSKLDSMDLPTEAKYILRNTRSLDRPVSLLVAAELYAAFPLIATQLELHRPIIYNQYFVPVDSVLDMGEAYCYDLEVENTHTYISNGFVSHNSQIELRVVAEIIYSISGDDTMLQEFIAGKDPYAATAAMMASIDYSTMVYVDPDTGETKVKKEFKTLRQNAKAVRLGYNYCLSGNTLIPTDRGLCRIKDITTKDKVLTHTGKYQNVIATQKVYSNDLVKVVTSTGKVLTMTPDHKLLVILPRTNKRLNIEYEWKEALELNIGDYLVANKAEYKMPTRSYFVDSRYSKVLGWFLSEGVYSNGLFYIAQDPVANSVIYQEMDNVLSSLGFFRYPNSLDRFYVHAKDRKHLMDTVNIEWKHNSKHKNFTDIRSLLNRTERLDLIGALWDGDGCICVSNNKLSITYHSLSHKLITDIQYLLSSFGINSRISKRKSKLYELRIIGSVGMSTFLSIVPTSKTVHADKLKIKRGITSRIKTEEKIVSIDYLVVDNHPMYDITVETDHSFIANGLVSHNCMGYKKFRNYAKTTYGVTMTLNEAQASRNLYFAAYPGLTDYHNQFKDKNLKTVHSLPPFSRPRHFDEYPGIPALANHPVQSTSADIQKLAQAILYESLYKLGYSPTQSSDMRMISTIHDELVSECLPHLSEQLKVLQQSSMESAAKTIIKGCPVIAEANVIANLAQKG